MYLELAKGVCILAITDENQILCVKKYRDTFQSWEWELPTGMIETNYGGKMETAKRKLEEETSYQAEHWMNLGSFYPSPELTNEEIFLYAAAGLTPIEQIENSNQIDLHKLSMVELKNLVKNGEFKQGAGLAAILRYKFLTD